MYKPRFNKRNVLKFTKFGRKGYSLFASLGKEVLIGTLGVCTLTQAAKADNISDNTLPVDTLALKTDKNVMLGEVEITGTRAPLSARQNVRMVTVLDKAQIKAAPVQSINDLLKYAVGVDVRQRGAIGAQTDVSIRGGNYEQITLLINGINICDPQTGHNAFDFPVDISEIERIEILEGPAGRAYGTSSLLGAINIITVPAAETSVSAHVGGGSYGYMDAGVRANMASGKFNNQISGGYTRSDGFSRSKDGQLNTDFKGGKAFYQGVYRDKNLYVNWHAGMSIKNFGSSTFYHPSFDNQFEHTFKSYTALQAHTAVGNFHFSPAVYWNRNMDRFELVRGSEEQVPFNYHRTDVYGLNLNSYFDWIAGRTAFCVNVRNEDLVSTNLGEPLGEPKHIHGRDNEYKFGINRTNIAITLEHNILLDRFNLSAGFVAVKNTWNEMNMRVYPGVDASYRIGENFKVYASYNTSLRMPSVTELYYSVGGHMADKYLEPEELSALEGGFKYTSKCFAGKVSVYHNRCKNRIDWVTAIDDNQGVWKSVNFKDIKSIGVETQMRFNLAEMFPGQKVFRMFDVAYSYINQNKAERQGYISRYTLEYLRHKVNAQLAMQIIDGLTFDAFYRMSDRTGIYMAEGKVRDYSPYNVFDARITWQMKNYKVHFDVNNIFDNRLLDYSYVPQPGRIFMGGLSVDF